MEAYLLNTRRKAIQCRNLFKNLLLKYRKLSFLSAAEKMDWVLNFLHQSENSYVIREHELRKFMEERGRND